MISHSPKLWEFSIILSDRRSLLPCLATRRTSLSKISFSAGAKRWRQSKRNRPNKWPNYANMQTSCSRRMNACEPVWRLTGVKTREALSILHPQLSQIRVKSPSSWEKVIPQQKTNYLMVALRSLTAHHPRTTQRLNLKRGPCAYPADPSVERVVGYKERPVETDTIRNWPSNICLFNSGVWLLSFRLCITHSGQPPYHIWFLFSLSGG